MNVESYFVLNPPCPVDSSPGPVDSVDAIKTTLNDESNYLSAEHQFSDIQDDGIKLTSVEVEVWCDKPAKRNQDTSHTMEGITKSCYPFPKS